MIMLEDFEEISIESRPDNDELSKRQTLLARMKEARCLDYGITLEESLLEDLLDMKKSEVSETEWNLALLQIYGALLNAGFFSTRRGKKGALYIHEVEEMPHVSSEKNRSSLQKLKLRQRALFRAPYDTNEELQKIFEFETNRNAKIMLHDSVLLKERLR